MATKKFFSKFPTTIVFETSSEFDGTVQTGDPTISGGVARFPVQAAGGLMNMHETPIEILNIAFDGTGTLTVTRKVDASASVIVKAFSAAGSTSDKLYLSQGESLLINSAGGAGKRVFITAREMPLGSV